MSRLLCWSVPLSLLIALALGCKSGKVEDEALLELDSLNFNDEIPLRMGVDTPSMLVNINYFFPKENEEMQRKFNAIFFGDSLAHLSPGEAMNSYVRYLGQAYKSDNFGDRASSLPAELFDQLFELSDTVLYVDSLLLSVRVTQYEEKGGAHGATTYSHYNLLRKGAVLLSERDLFVDGYKDELSAVLVSCLVEQLGGKTVKDLENEGFFNAEEILPNGNFFLNREGLTYCFNEYEIAAYAMGPIYVFIPYERLFSILKPDTPIKIYLP